MSAIQKVYLSRGRSLADFNAKFGEGVIENALRKAVASSSGKPVRLLEIGCGEGRVLLELRKLFPSVELHGINKKPWPAMRGEESLIDTARRYGIFSADEARRVAWPILHFYDAARLRFPDRYFDVVISQVSIYQFERKDLLLEEVWRVLKSGAAAFLHLDSACEGYPDFLGQETPRFLLYRGNKPYPFKRWIQAIRKKGYDITCRTAFGTGQEDRDVKRTSIVMVKNRDAGLNLDLAFDELSSFDIGALGKRFNGDKLVGYRSVYRVNGGEREGL